MVHFLDVCMIAKYTTFLAEFSLENSFLHLVANRMTLLRDSIAFVVYMALRISGG